jgi:hypothetical protein
MPEQRSRQVEADVQADVRAALDEILRKQRPAWGVASTAVEPAGRAGLRAGPRGRREEDRA